MGTSLLAQLRNPVLPPLLGGTTNPNEWQRGGEVVGKIIGSLIGAIFIFAFVIGFMYLLLGGISWITSGGDKTQLEHARNKITHALVGLILVAAVWAIAVLVSRFLGIDLAAGASLRFPIPTIQ